MTCRETLLSPLNLGNYTNLEILIAAILTSEEFLQIFPAKPMLDCSVHLQADNKTFLAPIVTSEME